ncbi:MAG: phosphoenolpyruvate carboxylase, partial [Burkholderiales bacterium]
MTPKPQRSTSRKFSSPALSSHERPLVDDIRWLGRILGDIIREQEGDKAFALVEQIRRLSVAFRRDADTQAGTALKKLLASLSSDQAVSVIRA